MTDGDGIRVQIWWRTRRFSKFNFALNGSFNRIYDDVNGLYNGGCSKPVLRSIEAPGKDWSAIYSHGWPHGAREQTAM
ncbi:hypothetical protein SDJN02_20984, partial [Cucurbita argyrosperma subsp. argyrosperma]